MRRSLCIASLMLSTGAAAAAPQKHGPWDKDPRVSVPWVYPVTLGAADGTNLHEASCASAGERVINDVTINYWILGFWTGMNTATASQVGRSTDTKGVLGEVKLYCDAHPSATITEATTVTYQRLKSEGK